MNQGGGIFFHLFVNWIAAMYICPKRIRNKLYRLAGIQSESVTFGDHCYFSAGNVSVGKDTYINRNVYFDDVEMIKIGNNVAVGMNTHFITSSHQIGDSDRRAGVNVDFGIIVEDGVWIGCDCTILPGTSIGAGTVIAGGSTLYGVIGANEMWGGAPARKIKEL